MVCICTHVHTHACVCCCYELLNAPSRVYIIVHVLYAPSRVHTTCPYTLHTLVYTTCPHALHTCGEYRAGSWRPLFTSCCSAGRPAPPHAVLLV